MIHSLSAEEIFRIRHLAADTLGIALEERHRDLLGRRVSRLGNPSILKNLLDGVEAGHETERQKFVQLLTTSHTSFFRSPLQFDLAAEHALWMADRQHRVRVWCAGVATGEEAYSLAIALIELFGRNAQPGMRLPVEILATIIRRRGTS